MCNPHAVVLTPNAKDMPKLPLEHGSEIFAGGDEPLKK
jgi:hypothetical protein